MAAQVTALAVIQEVTAAQVVVIQAAQIMVVQITQAVTAAMERQAVILLKY